MLKGVKGGFKRDTRQTVIPIDISDLGEVAKVKPSDLGSLAWSPLKGGFRREPWFPCLVPLL
jgi:hypothetical protein